MIVGGRSLWDLAEDRAAEITRLRERVAVLERQISESCDEARHDPEQHPCPLGAKLAAAERDAARYRYLRDDGYGITIDVLEYDDDGGEDWVSGHSPADLDAAIDRFRQPDNGGIPSP